MNRNSNMMGNLSNTNGKGLKPGDSALNNKKGNNLILILMSSK
jgi:hypothetical protein